MHVLHLPGQDPPCSLSVLPPGPPSSASWSPHVPTHSSSLQTFSQYFPGATSGNDARELQACRALGAVSLVHAFLHYFVHSSTFLRHPLPPDPELALGIQTRQPDPVSTGSCLGGGGWTAAQGGSVTDNVSGAKCREHGERASPLGALDMHKLLSPLSFPA